MINSTGRYLCLDTDGLALLNRWHEAVNILRLSADQGEDFLIGLDAHRLETTSKNRRQVVQRKDPYM